jgi:hypothetical protein
MSKLFRLSYPLAAVAISATGAFMLTASSPAVPDSPFGPFFDPISNLNLFVLPPGTWTQCEKRAEELGGTLMTISSAEENEFVVKNVLRDFSDNGGPNLSFRPLWIGLYDPAGIDRDDDAGGPSSQHAANFVWVNRSPATYRNWNTDTGEPNNYRPCEYYGTINWHTAFGDSGVIGTWNDTPVNGTVSRGGNTDGPYYGIAAVPAH